MIRRTVISMILMLMLCLLPTVDAAESPTFSTQAGELIIFHTNDQHARVSTDDDDGKSIGLAEMSAAVKATKAKNPLTLWIDAGDTFHGTPRINISKGMHMVELLNIAGVDVVTPGNHDFNYGFTRLEQLSKAFDGSLLSANIARRKNHKLAFKPYKIFKMADGTRVGVIGLSTPDTAYSTNPSNITTIEFLDPIEQSKLIVGKIRSKVDVLIAVTHLGVNDSSSVTSKQLAREVPQLDLIVDGHSHTTLPEGLMIGNTLIVQTGWHEHTLGRVKLLLRNHRITAKQAQLLDALDVRRIAPVPDAAVSDKLKAIDVENEKVFNEVIAHSERRLSGDRNFVRRHEAELGNLTSDAFRWKTGADIAIINGGPSGAITRGDILSIFPFSNTLEVVEIDGRSIKAMLEHSVAFYPDEFGGFMSVSGATFTFDPSARVGARISDVYIGDAPLDESKTYTLAASDFQLAGGDGYDMLVGQKSIGKYGATEDAVVEYLNTVGMPDIEIGRINVVGESSAREAA